MTPVGAVQVCVPGVVNAVSVMIHKHTGVKFISCMITGDTLYLTGIPNTKPENAGALLVLS